jgi:hypothetical protein
VRAPITIRTAAITTLTAGPATARCAPRPRAPQPRRPG